MKHSNPYRIKDPDDIFDVTENSSHPELQDARRVWIFGAYTFTTATELHKFFSNEGLNPRNYVMEPYMKKNMVQGKNEIHIKIVEKWKSRSHKRLKELSFDKG